MASEALLWKIAAIEVLRVVDAVSVCDSFIVRLLFAMSFEGFLRVMSTEQEPRLESLLLR